MKKFLTMKCKNLPKNSSKIIVLIIAAFLPFHLSAQKTKQLTAIKGTAYISDDISPKQARLLALNDAKINALKAAGIEEHINTYQLLFSSQVNNDYSQFFNSDIQSELQGSVQSYEIKNERKYVKNEIEWIYEVTIDAVVIKYDTKPDVAFDAYVEGIKQVYNNNDKLVFNIKTAQDAYLTIFNITDSEAFVMYPNAYEKQILLKELTTYYFPLANIDYTLHTDLKSPEVNRLIFVFTKTPITFIKMSQDQVTTHENIFSWIYSVMPDQRKVEYISFSINN